MVSAMKKLFALLLLICLNASADQVSFGWSPNTEPKLIGYRLFWGALGGSFDQMVFIPAGVNRVTVEMEPESDAFLIAFSQTTTSFPTGILHYHPSISEVVLDETSNLRTWTRAESWEIYRAPDAVFHPPAAAMQLFISRRGVVGIRALVSLWESPVVFSHPVDFADAEKFFRSYVAVRP
jgi:hypothetical protein